MFDVLAMIILSSYFKPCTVGEKFVSQLLLIIIIDLGLASQVTLECLSYHATAALEDAVKLSRRKIPSAAALKLHSFSFDDFSLSDEETLQVSHVARAS